MWKDINSAPVQNYVFILGSVDGFVTGYVASKDFNGNWTDQSGRKMCGVPKYWAPMKYSKPLYSRIKDWIVKLVMRR